MLALMDLMAGGQDASAYALQIAERQQEIIAGLNDEKFSVTDRDFKLVALGYYLRAILAEDALNYSVAERAFQSVADLEPTFAFAERDLQRIQEGHGSERGNGVVHVIALVGRGPQRIESESIVTRDALAIAQVIWGHYRRRLTFPNIASVRIPAIGFYDNNPTEAHVYADGVRVGQTEVLTDVEEVARREFATLRPVIVARAALRRAVKIAVTEITREQVNERRDAGVDLGLSLLGLLWTAVEQADLRCWSLLPASFQVSRLELPEGAHEITIRAGQNGNPTGQPQTLRIGVRDGYSTYVVCLVPTLEGGPPPQSSEVEVGVGGASAAFAEREPQQP